MSRYMTCSTCGHRLLRVKDNWGAWDGETYYCPYCAVEEDDDEMSETCIACGNPAYPDCCLGCDILEDD